MDLCGGGCFLGTEQLVPVIDSSSARLAAGRKGSDKSDMKEPECLKSSYPNFFFHLRFPSSSDL